MAFETLTALHVTDQALYGEYRKRMRPILESMGGGFRYDFVIGETLLSEAPHPVTRVFAIYFPDRATKEKFFADPTYQKVRKEFYEKSVAARTVIAEYDR